LILSNSGKKSVVQRVPKVAAHESGTQISKIEDDGSNMANVDPENLKLKNKKKIGALCVKFQI